MARTINIKGRGALGLARKLNEAYKLSRKSGKPIVVNSCGLTFVVSPTFVQKGATTEQSNSEGIARERYTSRTREMIAELEKRDILSLEDAILENMSETYITKVYDKHVPQVVAEVKDHRGGAAGIGTTFTNTITKGGNGRGGVEL